MKRLFYLLYYIVCLSAFPQVSQASESDAVYDSLSRLPSKRLMEEGRRYFEQREAAKSLACFVIVSGRTDRQADIRQTIRALNNCGCVYKYFYFDYVQAYEYFERAYDLCEQNGYDDFLPVIMVNLGDLFNDYSASFGSQSLSEQAKSLFDQCIERAVEHHNWELMTTAFFNLSNQNYSLPLDGYRAALFSEEVPDTTPDIQYVRLQYQGLALLQQQRTAEARDCFQRQLQAITARWGAERDTLASYMSIAHTYLLEGDYPREADYLEQAFRKVVEWGDENQSASICRLLSESFAHQGDGERQKYYRQLYLEKLEQAQASRLESIGELSYIHELKKKEEQAQVMVERQRLQQYVLLAIIVALLVVLGSALLLWRKNRQLRSRNKSLYEKNRQLLQAEREQRELRKEITEAKHEVEREAKSETKNETKYSGTNLSDDQKAALIFRIQQVLDDVETICQPDFTLARLAKQVESNTTYVSQVVNEKFGTAFSNVLAGYRIREACSRMSDESGQYDNITIEGIAFSVGFKSRTSFINAFKREVGLTPSEYLRMAQGKSRPGT